VAEKSGFNLTENGSSAALQEFADRMTREAMESMPQAAEVDALKDAAPAAPAADVVIANGLPSA